MTHAEAALIVRLKDAQAEATRVRAIWTARKSFFWGRANRERVWLGDRRASVVDLLRELRRDS